MQHNYITKNDYQGKNQVELMAVKEEKGFKSDAWLTFLQARDSKLKIKKGSKGVSIFKGFKKFVVKKKNGENEEKTGGMGFARVFNLDQTEHFKNNI